MKTKIKLGDLVVDEITGYEGIAVGIINYLNGCARIGIQSKERGENALPVDTYWVDDVTVKVVKKQVKKTVQNETGGANMTSSRNSVPVMKNF